MNQREYDPTDVAGRANAAREDGERKRAVRDEEIADLKWLMSSHRGRRFMWRLLGIGRTFQLSFDTNAMRMAFNEGTRNVGNTLLAEVMNACPDMYPVMEKEQRNDRDGNGKQSN